MKTNLPESLSPEEDALLGPCFRGKKCVSPVRVFGGGGWDLDAAGLEHVLADP